MGKKKMHDMRGTLKVAFLVAVCVGATPHLSSASGETSAAHEGAEHNRNVVELFLGGTYEDSGHGEEWGLSVGLTYERRLSGLFGMGGTVEYTAGDFDKWVIAIPLFLHPHRGWRFEAAPGLEIRDDDEEFLFRLGAAYEFELSDEWIVMPEFNVDFVDGEEALVFGLVVGYGF